MFEIVEAQDVLEHLDDKVKPMEEIWRVTKNGGLVYVQVPNWTASDYTRDPTHKQLYGVGSMDFFDVDNDKIKDRGYVSHARFKVRSKTYFVSLFGRTLSVRGAFHKRFWEWVNEHNPGFLKTIQWTLEVVK